METCVIDRLEGGFAVCVDESRRVLDIPRAGLPSEAREGDHLRREPDGVWTVDAEATRQGREALRERMNRLWAD